MSIDVKVDGNKFANNKHSRRWLWFLTVTVIFVFLYLGVNGNHNKMPGFETNINGQTIDTLSDTVKHIVTITDTVRQTASVKNRIKDTKQLSIKRDASQKSKYDIHDNKFNAPTMIGDNNTQTNNYGDISNEPTNEDLLKITTQVPIKTDTIFLRQSTTNNKNELFCQKIAYKLSQDGYINIGYDDRDSRHIGVKSTRVYVMPTTSNTHVIWVDCNY